VLPKSVQRRLNVEKFLIDKRLISDSSLVTVLNLCQVRLHRNAAFPWILLIPMQDNVSEIIDLSSTNQQLLLQAIAVTSKVMQKIYKPKKLNIANLGNMVPQLHVHVIARYENDGAWPNPVWNSGVTDTYEPQMLIKQIEIIKATFAQLH
jgi:diadenosine tetraphosphate (Ap4A) HIT family hydrolase